jgi:hypothetical protein
MAWEDLSEYEKGYIAGFLDGEGSISISKHSTIYFRLCINLTNSNLNGLKWVKKTLDNFLSKTEMILDKREKQERHNLQVHHIQIRRPTDCIFFLKNIEPYLKIKNKQAKLGVKFSEKVLNREDFKYSDKFIKELEKFYFKMKELNGRGE